MKQIEDRLKALHAIVDEGEPEELSNVGLSQIQETIAPQSSSIIPPTVGQDSFYHEAEQLAVFFAALEPELLKVPGSSIPGLLDLFQHGTRKALDPNA